MIVFEADRLATFGRCSLKLRQTDWRPPDGSQSGRDEETSRLRPDDDVPGKGSRSDLVAPGRLGSKSVTHPGDEISTSGRTRPLLTGSGQDDSADRKDQVRLKHARSGAISLSALDRIPAFNYLNRISFFLSRTSFAGLSRLWGNRVSIR